MAKMEARKLPAHILEREIAGIQKLFADMGLSKRGQQLLRRMLMDSEWLMIARRVHIAQRLLKNESFSSICKTLNVGWSTIEHVDRWLDDELGAAREAIRRKRDENPMHEVPFSPRWLAKTFPDHLPMLRAVLGLDRRK